MACAIIPLTNYLHSCRILPNFAVNCCDVLQSGDGGGDDAGAGLLRELLADASELRKLFDMYMNQLAALTGGREGFSRLGSA